MSESMQPEQLSSFLNDYLTRMTNLVLDSRGVVDKYIGDAVMAFWGAPLKNEHHAIDGVKTALQMVESLDEFNTQNEGTGRPRIDIGIGLNSGEVTVGNMGSERRFDYTVIGDNVNLASRLESLTKTYGVNIMVSEATKKLLADDSEFLLREIDTVQVKGKKKGVIIFEVVPAHKHTSVQNIFDSFEKGRQHYYAGRWSEALIEFENILQQIPNDGPTLLLKKRAEEFIKNPPEQWEGVYTMKEK